MTQALDSQYHSRLEKAKLIHMTFESSHQIIVIIRIWDLKREGQLLRLRERHLKFFSFSLYNRSN